MRWLVFAEGEDEGAGAALFGVGGGEGETLGVGLGDGLDFLGGDIVVVGEVADVHRAFAFVEPLSEVGEEGFFGVLLDVGGDEVGLVGEPASEVDGEVGGGEEDR